MELNLSSINFEAIMFYILGIFAIPLAYGVIFDRAVIRSGFLLIGLFGAISGLFLLLQAQFLALAQLMIYAVGITLVVVIALMLTNPRLEKEMAPALQEHKLGAFVVAGILFLTIYQAVLSESWPATSEHINADVVKTLGYSLITTYSLPFEFASVLLLVALVGAIMLAKSDKGQSASELDINAKLPSAEITEVRSEKTAS
jgi:NAD(P)H-quinone oxidoreductase subunit 6